MYICSNCGYSHDIEVARYGGVLCSNCNKIFTVYKPPKKLLQTRFGVSFNELPSNRGNCFPCVIACIMELDSAEDVLQVQEYYDLDNINDPNNWYNMLFKWLMQKGWQWGSLDGHQYDNSYYFVIGKTSRGTSHVCIYKNGRLWHDPHPSNDGIVDEEVFEYIKYVGH